MIEGRKLIPALFEIEDIPSTDVSLGNHGATDPGRLRHTLDETHTHMVHHAVSHLGGNDFSAQAMLLQFMGILFNQHGGKSIIEFPHQVGLIHDA